MLFLLVWKLSLLIIGSLVLLISITQVPASYLEVRNNLSRPLSGSNISHICSPDKFPIDGLKIGSFPPLYDAVVVEDTEKNISVGLFFTMAGIQHSPVVAVPCV